MADNRSIDERLEFLLKSTETLHDDCTKLYRATAELAKLADKHERNWERMRRAVQAGLEEFFSDDNNGDNQ